MNFPNALTLFRIFLVPLLVVIILTRFEQREILGVTGFLVAAATDWLDGFLARRWRQITLFGKLIDPIADKILIAAAFIALIQTGAAEAWMVILIVGREFAVDGLRLVAQAQNVTIPASRLGKYKTIAQIVCIVLLILDQKIQHLAVWVSGLLQNPEPAPWFLTLFLISGKMMLWIVMVIALFSGIDYFHRFYRKIDLAAAVRGRG